ncbi:MULTISPECIES: hypothetical protein [Rhodophyticola]|jgi:hypothetical protein|uniref:Uncharacterized protein n=1 Tax=Rhodophyticola porphyridii TaxID=1852017 RepID=A0A3L9Y729_9RHOB|nr:hypothetical protein [Rhodophyticola porphyridii]MBO6602865.1 hypothetical protein [Roseicyclus sp.]MBO6625411.1 hypothetical protein [Roseicyclus sp.]MBO6923734.1 hypothetical protein [Roseicyclus sp.]RMA43275.1 hypothetical protein D9R08_06585 [Rhodophyticola porphyridii]
MEVLIWIGTGLAALGLVAIVYCIVAAISAKRANLSDDELRARLQRVVPINMGAVLASALGLMTVVIGVFLT